MRPECFSPHYALPSPCVPMAARKRVRRRRISNEVGSISFSSHSSSESIAISAILFSLTVADARMRFAQLF